MTIGFMQCVIVLGKSAVGILFQKYGTLHRLRRGLEAQLPIQSIV